MKTIILLFCFLVGFINAFSQEKLITKTAFEEITKISTEIFNSKPFRATVSTEILVNGKPQANTLAKTVIEVTAGKRRFFNQRTSQETTSKNEYIQIGEKAYSRENEGQWKETAVFDPNKSERNLKIIDEQAEYKSLGTENLNDQPTNVFLKTSKTKRIDEANGNREILSVQSVKYWFGKDGALLKRETRRENRTGDLVFNFHFTSLFEYDQSIQITVPK